MKRIKLNKSKHKKSPWITEGVIKSIKFRDNLHMKLKNFKSHVSRISGY